MGKAQKPHGPTVEAVLSINDSEWKSYIHPEVAQRYHDEVVAEFPDVFGDKLPSLVHHDIESFSKTTVRQSME